MEDKRMGNFFDFKVERLREGQRKALDVIRQRAIAHEPYTAIVIPTRYGKSDLARVAAIQLTRNNVISTAFALSPGVYLRNQFASHGKWAQCIDRYDLPRATKYHLVKGWENSYGANGECLLSATIQLIVSQIDEFCKWTRSQIATTGKPPLFFIDECQMTSTANKWGGAAEKLAASGALIVLLTATPIRDDHRPPAGFPFVEKVVNEDAQRTACGRGSDPSKITVRRFEGSEIEIRLVAHHETTFEQAWEERPSPLCEVNYVPFDVFLRDTELEIEEGERPEDLADLSISTMNVKQVRQYLGRICRDPGVIREGARRLVQKLKERRTLDSKVAAMVFCDIDRRENGEDVIEVNRWAKKIEKAIKAEAQLISLELETVIATSASEENEEAAGNKAIEKFSSGLGDVLIVKQMGGAGLDCERIKIVLDLSPVRTLAAWIQRIMRAATPYGPFHYCDLISPDDCIARNFWRSMIKDQGGAAKFFEGELVDEYEVARKEREWMRVIGTGNAPFHDNTGQTAEPEKYDFVRCVTESFPVLQLHMTDVQISEQGGSLYEKLRNQKGPVANVDADLKEMYTRLDDQVHDITMARLGGKYEAQEYGRIKSHVWHEAYTRAGAQKPLERITDLKVLHHVEAILTEIARSTRPSA
jgi:hypothetical protein